MRRGRPRGANVATDSKGMQSTSPKKRERRVWPDRRSSCRWKAEEEGCFACVIARRRRVDDAVRLSQRRARVHSRRPPAITPVGRIVVLANGTEALDVIRREQPDVALLDVMMPERSGFDVCEAVKSDPSTRLIPVVLVTAL